MIVWLAAGMIEVAHVSTGWTVIDEFAHRFVYFYTGYILAPYIFEMAVVVQERKAAALVGLGLWSFINGAMVATGAAGLPFVSLALGFMGAGAVVAASALMAQSDLFRLLRYCGRHSIVIYLAFFLPMAAARTGLPMAAAKAGVCARSGNARAAGDAVRRNRGAGVVLGGAPDAVPLPVRAAGDAAAEARAATDVAAGGMIHSPSFPH